MHHRMPYSQMLCLQNGDHADDTVLETFLQTLAVDRSKVIRYAALALLCGMTALAAKGMSVHMGS